MEYKKKNIKKVSNRRPTAKKTAAKLPDKPPRPVKQTVSQKSALNRPEVPTEEVAMKPAKHKKPEVPKAKKETKPKKQKQTGTQKTAGTVKRDRQFRVIKGAAKPGNIGRTVAFGICCILLIAIVLFSALTPTGPFEYIENKIKSFGNGSFPVSVSGSEMLNAYSVGSLTYVLTDTHAEVYNGSGKQLFSRQHSFNSPAMRVSSQRAIVYDQGGKELHLFSCSDVIRTMTFDYEIYCAAIARNGTMAVATKSKGYASQVEVFSKNGTSKFVWYSANEMINNVALSDGGNRLAVSTVSVSGGDYKSKLYIFKYNSADPLYEMSYDSAVIYSLESVSSSQFAAVCDGSVDYIKWRKGTKTENKNPYTLNIFRYERGAWGAVVTGNKSSSNIIVRSAGGKELCKFDFAGAVTDISVEGKQVYVLSDGYLYTLDFNGKQIAEKYNMSSYGRIFAHSSGTVISAGNFGLDKYKN